MCEFILSESYIIIVPIRRRRVRGIQNIVVPYFRCLLYICLPVRAILYGGKRLPFRAPRAKPAPNATQIAPTTAKPMYNGQSEPVTMKANKK